MKLLALADLGRAGIHVVVVVVVGNLGKSCQCQAPPPCSVFSLPPSCPLLHAVLLAFLSWTVFLHLRSPSTILSP